MKTRKVKYVAIPLIIIIAVVLFFALKILNDHRARDLVDLIGYDASDFQALGITMDWNEVAEDSAYEWFTENQEPANELIAFLSHYRVKRVDEQEFMDNLEDGERMEITLSHKKGKTSMVWIHEEDIHILVGNYYEVINGPIDMAWLKSYNEKYKELYQ